jgi:hypothetical protein
MAWSTNGVLIDPDTNDLLADTGALSLGTYSFVILAWSDTACGITLHHRNATNTADVHSQKLQLTTTSSAFAQIVTIPAVLLLNERLTLTLDNGFTGTIQCSILAA